MGHPTLDRVHSTAVKHDRACKLTGAGGGGCAIVLLQGHDDAATAGLKLDLARLNCDTFSSRVGGKGVKWHSQYPMHSPEQTAVARVEAGGQKQDDAIRLAVWCGVASRCGVASWCGVVCL